MHKEWVKVAGGYANLDKTKPWRYIEEYSGSTDEYKRYNLAGSGYEQEVDVRDESDNLIEPEEDGLYSDRDGERWVRLNGKWVGPGDGFEYCSWSEWMIVWGEAYGPFTKVDLKDY